MKNYYALSETTRATFDKYLTNVSRGLFPKEEEFLCEKLLPEVNVIQTSGKIGSYDNEHLRILNTFMGGRGEAVRIEHGTKSSDNYLIEKHGLACLITEEEYANTDLPFDAEEDAMAFLMSRIWLGKEYALSSNLTSSSVMTKYSSLSGTQQWSDYDNSSPITDFLTARTSVWDYAKRRANNALINFETLIKLQFHPEILAYFKINQGQASVEQIKMLMGVDNLHIAMASYNSADRGQSDTLNTLWGNHLVMYYAPKNPTKRDQSLGFLVKRKDNRKVYKNNISNPPESKEIIVVDNYDYVITDVNCGYLLQNVIA